MKNKLLFLLLVLGWIWGTSGCETAVPDDDDTVDDDSTDDDDDGADDDSADDDTGPVDADGDGHDATEDCDDTNADVYPGAAPICDGVEDNDCDGITDEGEADLDGDGFSECTGDCDDTNAAIHGGAWDILDGLDNDCDGDTDEDVIDCAALPASPTVEQFIPGARGSHGLAIDDAGIIVGSDCSALLRSDYQGNASVWVPGQGCGQEMTYLPDGHLVWVDDGQASLKTFDQKGTSVDLANASGAYGLIYGPDDYLYMSQGNNVKRVDPVSGIATTVTTLPGATTRSLDFSPDYSKMYISTQDGGDVYQVDLDANLDAIDAPTVLATGMGDYLDGLRVGACGYLYVPSYSNTALYRISPNGDVETFVDWPSLQEFGHGVIFGNGIGGWSATSLFLPVPYNGNTVKEVGVGEPSRAWGGTTLNAP